jgi:hypothetical protein
MTGLWLHGACLRAGAIGRLPATRWEDPQTPDVQMFSAMSAIAVILIRVDSGACQAEAVGRLHVSPR